MPPKFPNPDLVACARREVAMRAAVYPRKSGVETIVDCPPKQVAEHAMMEAIAEQLEALPELLTRYQKGKDVLRDILPQPYTFDYPHENVLVLVYCRNSDRPWLARRVGLNEWQFETNGGSIMEDGMDSKEVFAFSYLPAVPKQ